MNVTDTMLRASMIVQGIKVQVPIFVTDETLAPCVDELSTLGIPLAAATSIMQQTLVENIRNNTAPAVTKLIATVLAAAGVEAWDGKINSLDDEQKALISKEIDTEAAQTAVDTYITSYIPGVRKASSAEPIDPVEALARKIAKQAVQDRLEKTPFSWEGFEYTGVGRTARAESYKAFDAYCQATHESTAAEFIDSRVETAVEQVPYFTEQAQRQIQEALAASESLEFAI